MLRLESFTRLHHGHSLGLYFHLVVYIRCEPKLLLFLLVFAPNEVFGAGNTDFDQLDITFEFVMENDVGLALLTRHVVMRDFVKELCPVILHKWGRLAENQTSALCQAISYCQVEVD